MMVIWKRVFSSFLLLAMPAVVLADSLYIKHKHTGEEERIVFKVGGAYSPAGLKKLNWILRDWRVDEPTEMDPALFDIIHEIYKQTGASEPIHVVSAFRSEGTNAMLRRRSRAVARNSQHIQGKAMDFYIPGVSTAQIREIALKLEQGGVGFYPRAGTAFIHVDSGSVRHWPKMTREQLTKVFPRGNTVHIPRDGKPLNGFDLALANLQKRGGTFSHLLASSNVGEVEEKGDGGRLFAALFGRKPVDPPQLKTVVAPKASSVVENKPQVVQEEKDEVEEEKPAAKVAERAEKIPFKILPPPKFLIASAPLPSLAPREREMMRANSKLVALSEKASQKPALPSPSISRDVLTTRPSLEGVRVASTAPFPTPDPRAGYILKVKPSIAVKLAEAPLPSVRKDNILSITDKIVPQSFASPLIPPTTNAFSGSSVVRLPSLSFR